MASIQKKKKMEQYNHTEKLKINFELDWWTFMIVKNNMARAAVCRSKCHAALKVQKQVFLSLETL